MLPLLRRLQKRPDVDLHLVLACTVTLDKYSKDLRSEINALGLPIHDVLHNVIEGGNHIAAAKTACLTALDFTSVFQRINPDLIVINGDRFEQLAIAMVAAYLNKTIVHIEGGDSSGTIDESVRHAITKLSHLHFVTNRDAKRRLIQMGEFPETVHHVGSLDIEAVASVRTKLDADYINRHGVGGTVDITKPFMMVMYHPVTTHSEGENWTHVRSLIEAVIKIGLPVIWFWPNNDAGSSEISEALRHFREGNKEDTKHIRFVTNVPSDEFIALLSRTACLVGNSSVGIKESSYLGVPVVNVGDRQEGRLRAKNVIDSRHEVEDIVSAISRQLKKTRYDRSEIYYLGDTSKRIVDILTSFKPTSTQKKFYEEKK